MGFSCSTAPVPAEPLLASGGAGMHTAPGQPPHCFAGEERAPTTTWCLFKARVSVALLTYLPLDIFPPPQPNRINTGTSFWKTWVITLPRNVKIEIVMCKGRHCWILETCQLLERILHDPKCVRGRQYDGRAEKRVLILCENSKITTLCWTTTDKRMLDLIKKKKIPHAKGQRRSPSKTVGREKLHLESNPLPTRDSWKAQSKSSAHQETPQRLSQICPWVFEYLLWR